jgi:hypothetical protein
VQAMNLSNVCTTITMPHTNAATIGVPNTAANTVVATIVARRMQCHPEGHFGSISLLDWATGTTTTKHAFKLVHSIPSLIKTNQATSGTQHAWHSHAVPTILSILTLLDQ